MFHNIQHELLFVYWAIRRRTILVITSIRNSRSCCAVRPENAFSGEKWELSCELPRLARVKGDLAPPLRNATDKKFLGESAAQGSARIPQGEIYRISRRESGEMRERTLSFFLSAARFFSSSSFSPPFLFLRHLCRLPPSSVIITAPPNLFREIFAQLSSWFSGFFSVRRPIAWRFN